MARQQIRFGDSCHLGGHHPPMVALFSVFCQSVFLLLQQENLLTCLGMMGSTFSFASVFPRVATDNVADFHQSRVCIPWQITCYPVAGIDFAECIQHSFVPSSFAFAWQGSFLFLLIPWFIRCRMCRILTHMLGIAVASTCWYTVWNTMGSLGCICFRFDHLGIFQLINLGDKISLKVSRSFR